MIIHNPTGGGLREDPAGSGRFGASRGNRKHEGYDFLCEPGQLVKAPIPGRLVRAYPYADDLSYMGCRIWGPDFMVKAFYFEPYDKLINEMVLAGEVIGIAQDISLKYGGGMLPHIHCGLYKLNPTKLVNIENYLDTEENRLKNGGY